MIFTHLAVNTGVGTFSFPPFNIALGSSPLNHHPNHFNPLNNLSFTTHLNNNNQSHPQIKTQYQPNKRPGVFLLSFLPSDTGYSQAYGADLDEYDEELGYKLARDQENYGYDYDDEYDFEVCVFFFFLSFELFSIR